MDKMTIGDIEVDIVQKDIENLHLGVYPPNGRVRIAAPNKMDHDNIRLFAISKIPWIKNQKSKFKEQNRQSEREFVSGESHYFEGERYLLNVIYRVAKPKVKVRNKKYIDLYVREGSIKEKRKEVMTEWYRERLKERIPALIEKWEEIMKVEVGSWGIRLMKTKWGSCDQSSKRILLNLELAKKNKSCLEYIVVHEMVHLLEREHNDRFIAYMDKFLPNWRSVKDELNDLIFESSDWSY